MERVGADRVGRGHAVIDIAGIEPRTFHRAPDAGIAIGLEFEPDREGVALRAARSGHLLLDLARRAEQLRDVMAEFVREPVILREIALGAEAVLKLIEKARGELASLIAGAGERQRGE